MITTIMAIMIRTIMTTIVTITRGRSFIQIIIVISRRITDNIEIGLSWTTKTSLI